MFGCYAIYIGEKIVLILRKSAEHTRYNGVWIATSKEDHASLRKEFPVMRSINLLGRGVTNWQVIPERSKHFESLAIHACELIARGDARIGRVPARKTARRAR